MTFCEKEIWWKQHFLFILIIDILLFVGFVFVAPTWTPCAWEGGNVWLALYLVIVVCFVTLNIADLTIGYVIEARTEAYAIVVEEAKQLVGALQAPAVSDRHQQQSPVGLKAGAEIYIESIFNVPKVTNANLRFFAHVLIVYNTIHLTYVNVLHATKYSSDDVFLQLEIWAAILFSIPTLIAATVTIRWCKLAWMTWTNTNTAYARLQ